MSAFLPVTPLTGVANDLTFSSTKTSVPPVKKNNPLLHPSQDELLQPRTPFPHPYTPYSIQSQLMSRIYTTLKRKQIGIYESPTGTGKTLSLICSSLQWLREYQEYGSDNDETEDKTIIRSSTPSDEPDWCANYDKENETREKQQLLKKQKQYRLSLSERLNKIRIEEEEYEKQQQQQQQQQQEDEQQRKKRLLQDDDASQHSEDTGNDDLTDDSEYESFGTSRTTKTTNFEVTSSSLSAREIALRKAKRLALKKRKRRAFQDQHRYSNTTHESVSSTAKEKNRNTGTIDNINHGDDNEWLVAEYHSSSSSSSDEFSGGGNESNHHYGTNKSKHTHSHRKSHHSKVSSKNTVSLNSKVSSYDTSVSNSGSEAAQHTIQLADQIRAQLLTENTLATASASTPGTKHGKAKVYSGTNSMSGGGIITDPYLEAIQKEEENSFRPKILFVSRTHSQISQFVREISKTTFGKDARVVVLGSRRNLCINPDVITLASDSRINERCLELQDQARSKTASTTIDTKNEQQSDSGNNTGSNKKPHLQHASTVPPSSSPSTSNPFRIQRVDIRGKVIEMDNVEDIPKSTKTGGCPYLDPQEQSTYSDRLLARLRDVEDAAEIGWDMGTCAYYGSRAAVKHAEIIAMPYSMLLHAGTRQSSGINLDGNIIIIDEAHNIIDAINNTHASIVTHTQLNIACNVVRAYINKYSTRMKGSNLAYCTDLANIFEALSNFLKSPFNVKPVQSASVTIVNTSTATHTTNGFTNNPVTTTTGSSLPPGSSPADTLIPVSLGTHDKLTTVPFHNTTGTATVVTTGNTTVAQAMVLQRSASPVTSSIWGASTANKSFVNKGTTSVPFDSSGNSSTIYAISNHLINELTLAPVNNSTSSISISATLSMGGDPSVRSRTSSVSSETYTGPFVPSSSATNTNSNTRSTTPTFTSTPLPNITISNTITTANNHHHHHSTTNNVPNGLHTVSDFLSTAGLLNINLFHLRRYVETVDLLRKLRGFAEAGARAAVVAMGGNNTTMTMNHNMDNTNPILPWMNIVPGEVMIHPSTHPNTKHKSINNPSLPSQVHSSSSTPSYMLAVAAVQASYAFLISLMNADGDGRIIVNRQNQNHSNGNTNNSFANDTLGNPSFEPSYKFILLNPAVPFEDIVTRARSVILVGGTMQPMNDIVEQLFGHLPSEKVSTFSCGHIIPKENLAAFTVAKGPTGITLDFRHALRSSPAVMDELGRCLVNIASIVPGGIVVFLPSFDYLRTLLLYWNKEHTTTGNNNTNGRNNNTNPLTIEHNDNNTTNEHGSSFMIPHNPNSLLAQLSKRKCLFAEPRTANQADAILRTYTHVIQQGKAAATAVANRTTASMNNNSNLPYTAPPTKSKVTSMLPSTRNTTTDTVLQSEDDDTSRGSYSSNISISRSSTTTLHSSAASASATMVRFPTSTGNTTTSVSVLPSVTAATTTSSLSSTTTTVPPNGALLFCIVGGKMSEGINFSDDLARCVIVVGLPYPNPSDPELVERMNYLDHRNTSSSNSTSSSHTTSSTAVVSSTITNAGREYYENITMRAVNQAIGRSIRHAKDYATIVLLDTRYTNIRVRSKLPGWIQESIHSLTTNNSNNNNNNNNNNISSNHGNSNSSTNNSNSNSSNGTMTRSGNWGTVASGLGTFFRRKRDDEK